jgi:hypothetical protein
MTSTACSSRPRAGSSASAPRDKPSVATMNIRPGEDTQAQGIDGSASTHSPIRLSDNGTGCIADQGCPFAPTTIPNCVRQLQARSLSEEIGLNSVAPKRMVSVFGQLWVRPLVQLLECGIGCCNSAKGTIELRDGKANVQLADDRYPDAFKCSGDDSRICCGIDGVMDPVRSADDQRTVVVTGELNRETSPPTLSRPHLCQVAAATPPDLSCEGAEVEVVTGSQNMTRCACRNGQARCTSDRKACYLTGIWHKEATQLDIGGDDCDRLCRDGHWELHGDGCSYE